ncbi:acyltransferase family protein [Pseudomonas anguilliseptica]|uniref:acyltransferase family protein n=1 Tax=Pseudomonas anguilliseptica TaxID=53406 RepID=UPI0011148E90|nr:acyltransferase [Pseudomonas anguilliseptica]
MFFREPPAEEVRGALSASSLSFIGLALVVYSIAGYDHTMPYPGSRALAPVLGALLLILAGPQAWVNRKLLANKALVWIGLISYPLYLWHWPLLSFARIVESETPSPEIRIAAVLLSFILAALTYYLIEKPIRYGRSTWRKVTPLCVLAVVVGYVGWHTFEKNGFLYRGIAKGYDVFSYSQHWDGWGRCETVTNTKGMGGCRILYEKNLSIFLS